MRNSFKRGKWDKPFSIPSNKMLYLFSTQFLVK